MKLMMHVLKSNPGFNIDNEKIKFEEIAEKLNEEFCEVIVSIYNYSKVKSLSNLRDIIAEVFDLIQVCILLLWKCHRQAMTLEETNLIQDINLEHKDKLVDRGWIIKTDIEIDVKE